MRYYEHQTIQLTYDRCLDRNRPSSSDDESFCLLVDFIDLLSIEQTGFHINDSVNGREQSKLKLKLSIPSPSQSESIRVRLLSSIKSEQMELMENPFLYSCYHCYHCSTLHGDQKKDSSSSSIQLLFYRGSVFRSDRNKPATMIVSLPALPNTS